MEFDTIESAVAEIAAGRMVILIDDEDRENEGDLVLAAEKVTPDAINFMARHARGLICATLTPERADALHLGPMAHENTATFGTAFTVSVDAVAGGATGISAADRATTVRAIIDPATKPGDLARPGHVFPIRAQPGGVLKRAGQTEGSVDLARLAGLMPAGVICEIMNDDGTMARVPELKAFARRHALKIVTIKDLIEYRMKRESFVKRLAEAELATRYGEFLVVVYENTIDHGTHVALVKGAVRAEGGTLVRVHSGCVTGGVVGAVGWHRGEATAAGRGLRYRRRPARCRVYRSRGRCVPPPGPRPRPVPLGPPGPAPPARTTPPGPHPECTRT